MTVIIAKKKLNLNSKTIQRQGKDILVTLRKYIVNAQKLLCYVLQFSYRKVKSVYVAVQFCTFSPPKINNVLFFSICTLGILSVIEIYPRSRRLSFYFHLVLLFKLCHFCKTDHALVETDVDGSTLAVESNCGNANCGQKRSAAEVNL